MGRSRSKRSNRKGSKRDLITGSWVTQNDLQGRNTLGAIASGSGFEGGEDQFLFGTYSYKSRLDKKGRGTAVLFDDTDRDELSIKAKPRSVPSKPTSMQSIVFSNLMPLLATTQPMDTSRWIRTTES